MWRYAPRPPARVRPTRQCPQWRRTRTPRRQAPARWRGPLARLPAPWRRLACSRDVLARVLASLSLAAERQQTASTITKKLPNQRLARFRSPRPLAAPERARGARPTPHPFPGGGAMAPRRSPRRAGPAPWWHLPRALLAAALAPRARGYADRVGVSTGTRRGSVRSRTCCCPPRAGGTRTWQARRRSHASTQDWRARVATRSGRR